jgi:hypothetical protein
MACYLPESFTASLYLCWKYADDFSAGILANAHCGGDNCHRGAVVGALLGAANGVPDKWIEGLMNASSYHLKISHISSGLGQVCPANEVLYDYPASSRAALVMRTTLRTAFLGNNVTACATTSHGKIFEENFFFNLSLSRCWLEIDLHRVRLTIFSRIA